MWRAIINTGVDLPLNNYSLFGLTSMNMFNSNWSCGSLTIGTPIIDSNIEGIIDTLYEMRLETLLSVDDLVAAVMKTLEVILNLWLHSNPSLGWVFTCRRKMYWTILSSFTTVIMVWIYVTFKTPLTIIVLHLQAIIWDSSNNRYCAPLTRLTDLFYPVLYLMNCCPGGETADLWWKHSCSLDSPWSRCEAFQHLSGSIEHWSGETMSITAYTGHR